MEAVNSTTLFENLRNRVQDGYLYTMETPSGNIFGGSITTRAYYDKMLAAGDTPEDIIETIYQHRDDTPVQLSQLTRTP